MKFSERGKMKRNHCLTILSSTISLALSSFAYAADEVEAEFDTSFFKTSVNQVPVDTNRFKYGTPIAAGEYYSDIYVNGKFRGNSLIKFVENDKAPISGLCWSQNLRNLLELKPEAVVLEPDADACVSAVKALPGIKLKFNISEQRLNVEIPQALMVAHPVDYIPPSRWQNGITAAFVRYDFRGYQYNSENSQSNRQQYLGIRSGINAGGWSLRQQGAQSWMSGKGEEYQHHELYAQHDLDALKGRFLVGDFFSRSDVMDGFGLRGVALVSDDRMLPDSLRSYAPEIQGVANSNAQVRVSHHNQVVYETTVAPGPFVINDLNLGSYSGELQVEVIESDGMRRLFTVPFASTHRMLRPGRSRYTLTAGKYRENKKVYDSAVVQGSLQYGLNNHLTLQSGVTATNNYVSSLFGTVWGGKIGSLSTDFIVSRLTDADKRSRNSPHLRVSYNKTIPTTDTLLQIGMKQYFSKHSDDLQNAVYLNERNAGFGDVYHDALKSQYQVSVSQHLGSGLGSLYVSGISKKYWHRSGYQHEYQLGYGNSYRSMQYHLGFSQKQNLDTGKQDKQAFLTLSIPFDVGTMRNVWLSSSHSRTNRDQAYSRIALNGHAGSHNQFNYGISLGKPNMGEAQYSAHANYRFPFVETGVGISGNSDNSQISYNLTGAVVIHPYGLTLNHDLSDTFALVRAKGASGVPIKNGNGSKLDRWGYGVVASLTPYRSNFIGVDAEYLPDDIELSATEKAIIPRANTVGFIDMAAKKDKIVYFDTQLEDGSFPPMAAEVLDEQGEVVGYSVQDGRLFVKNIRPSGKLTVTWGEHKKDKCTLSYNLNQSKPKYNIYSEKCVF